MSVFEKAEPDTEIEPEVDLELYRSLLGESRTFLEKLPGLWLQKLTVIGAVAAFVINKDPSVKLDSELMFTAFLLIPGLAILVDVKVMELGIHARIVSATIADLFPDEERAYQWTMTYWGLGRHQALVKIRNWSTILSQTIPTGCVIFVAGLQLTPAGTANRSLWPTVLGVGYMMVTSVVAFVLMNTSTWKGTSAPEVTPAARPASKGPQ